MTIYNTEKSETAINFGHWKLLTEYVEGSFGFVYLIINTSNNRKYIGKKFLNDRWKFYKSSSKYLRKSIKEEGKENFEFYILSWHSSTEELAQTEIDIQTKLNVVNALLPNGEKEFYNLVIGHFKQHSEKWLQNMSAFLKNRECGPMADDQKELRKTYRHYHNPETGERKFIAEFPPDGFVAGRPPFSREVRDKMAAQKIGKSRPNPRKGIKSGPVSAEALMKIRSRPNPNIGTKRSEETKQKLRNSHIGFCWYSNHEQKISKQIKGDPPEGFVLGRKY